MLADIYIPTHISTIIQILKNNQKIVVVCPILPKTMQKTKYIKILCLNLGGNYTNHHIRELKMANIMKEADKHSCKNKEREIINRLIWRNL